MMRTKTCIRAVFITLQRMCQSLCKLSGGCFLRLSKKTKFSCLSCSIDNSGHFLCCDIVVIGVELAIICVYAPGNCQERNSFFMSLGNFLRTQRKILLKGHFNCVCCEQDKSRPRAHTHQSTATLSYLVHEYSLVDVGLKSTRPYS